MATAEKGDAMAELPSGWMGALVGGAVAVKTVRVMGKLLPAKRKRRR